MRSELDDTLAAPAAGEVQTVPVAEDGTATAPAAAPAAAPGPGHAPGLTPGQTLGHFRIERPLGAGGMGEVYLATDLALDRPVAIKVLPARVARDAKRRDRLVREARAQARINHPNVGHIYFIGEEAGHLYFAMEYVAGETLAARMATGPLSIDDALALVRSAALGLREAQRSGITHRDIKPSNLMIDGHGMVKVLDFGIAAGDLGAASEGAAGEGVPGPVAQTSLAGTPLYMAPEQARGEPVDFRADVYALGATLFHLVTGRPPFEADTLDGLLSKHASADRPTVPRRAGQPRTTIAALDALIRRMMAPAPADRFASYDELIRAIELASVDHMRPAGLWARSMATSIDFLITSALTAAIAMPIHYLLHIGNSLDLPILVAYTLYGIALVARNGRTLGQWLFELEVAEVATGGRPTLEHATIRVALPMAGPLIGGLIKHVLGPRSDEFGPLPQALFVAVWCAPPIALVWASLRSVGKQTFWDKLSHTMVRYRTRRTTPL